MKPEKNSETNDTSVIDPAILDASADQERPKEESCKRCNLCGRVFDMWDDFGFQYYIGYGSIYDGKRIDLHLCWDCFDKTLDWLLPQCRIDPMSDYF